MSTFCYIKIFRKPIFVSKEVEPIPERFMPEGFSEACVGFSGPAIEDCDMRGRGYIINPDHLISHIRGKCPDGEAWIERVFRGRLLMLRWYCVLVF